MEYHRYPIGPILERYGFDPIDTDRGWHAVRCEFHGDRDASGSVNTLDQIYNCFGCGMRGSGTQIIMKMEGLTYRRCRPSRGNHWRSRHFGTFRIWTAQCRTWRLGELPKLSRDPRCLDTRSEEHTSEFQ